jgi:hypothetical protein
MSSKIENKIYCRNDNLQFLRDIQTLGAVSCTDLIDESKMKKQLAEKCTGKNGCDINLTDLYKADLTVDPEGECGNEAHFFL